MTKDEIHKQIINYLLYCFPSEDDEEEILSLTYEEASTYMYRNFHGGLEAFIKCIERYKPFPK